MNQKGQAEAEGCAIVLAMIVVAGILAAPIAELKGDCPDGLWAMFGISCIVAVVAIGISVSTITEDRKSSGGGAENISRPAPIIRRPLLNRQRGGMALAKYGVACLRRWIRS